MNKDEVKKVWENYCAQEGNIKLNPESEVVDMLADGVLRNEAKHGLKMCPCRLRDGSFARDLELICPCNFEAHDTWNSKGRCWCGLFVKK